MNTDVYYDSKFSEHLDHLNYEQFSRPVTFRVVKVSSEGITPVNGVRKILGEWVADETGLDVALVPDERRAEFAFDAELVDGSAEDVIDAVQEFIEDFNTFPTETKYDIDEDDWEKMNVKLADVTLN